MTSRPYVQRQPSFLDMLATQSRVIGALLMRELHTRYGRENIGYLWLIGEPLMLGSVIALLHSGATPSHAGDVNPVVFATVGYTIFIMFRGIVNRSEGSLEANLPLLYHRSVTVLDITIAKAILEGAGTLVSYLLLISLLISIGFAPFPPRPLWIFLGVFYVFWVSIAVSMIIIGWTHDNRLLGRLVHPFTYFMIPLSASFYQVSWIPEPYRTYLLWNPLPHMFEIVRYGQFESATLEFVNLTYTTAACLVLTFLGLVAIRSVRYRVHLS